MLSFDCELSNWGRVMGRLWEGTEVRRCTIGPHGISSMGGATVQRMAFGEDISVIARLEGPKGLRNFIDESVLCGLDN